MLIFLCEIIVNISIGTLALLPDSCEDTTTVLYEHNEHTVHGDKYCEYDDNTDAYVRLNQDIVVFITCSEIYRNSKQS